MDSSIVAWVFTLIGVFLGLVAGMTSVVALYRATLRSSELEWRGRSERTDKPMGD
jgi:hypothetical protein